MATALEKISNHLECDICKEKYKRPKVLDCQHSFCEKCLEQYYKTTYGGQRKIPCPVCRREMVLPETRIQGLKTNFHLMGIVEEVSFQENELCSVVKTPEEAATLEDIRQGKVTGKQTPEEDESKCQKHMGEVKWFYCETCEELICRACTVVDHCKPNHHYIDSKKASHKYKISLKALFADVRTDITTLEQDFATASQAQQKFTLNVTKTVKAVKDKADKMRAEITSQETKMINKIKQLQQDRNRTYHEHQNTLSMMLQSKKRSLQTSQDITNAASDNDFLSQYPIISKDLKSLKSQNPPQIDPKHSYLSFTPSQRIGDINLGEIKEEAVKWEMCREFVKTGTFTRKLDVVHGITATQPGEIAVGDFLHKRVVLCSNEGERKGLIPLTSRPQAVAATHNPEKRLIVLELDSKYVKVFNMKDNTLVMQFPTVSNHQVDKTLVDLQSTAVRTNGTILVGDTRRMVWTEHKPTNGEILHTIPVQTPPWFLAVDDDTDKVFISGRQTNQVDVANSKGTTLFTIKPTIDGQPVLRTQGVCCDRSGIYLGVTQSGFGTNHIHHYDLDGRFLDCLAQDLYLPQAMTFTSDGQLAVDDWHSVKMYHKV
ncbi:E3 ubiquitin-protein ligase TRIM39-like [Patiria miniata]|uniref:Tripartite motif-containing protein 3 n=1 Tax=Patiria miniata TaxID=46514 RepID=A0A914AFM3_PATMI|nr:E3 ubiquitin-protein ligase TRIM39-like [Patiria miniata]